MFAFCLFSVISNWLLRTNLLCVMNAWTTFCGRIVRSSVWAPNAALPKWSEASSISLLSGVLFCYQSYSECGLFTIFSFLVHPNCAQILKSCLYFQNYTYSLFFMYLVFAGLTLSVYSSVSETFWLLISVTNKYAYHLPFPLKLWNTIAIVIYIPITLQWQIPYFKLNNLFLVNFGMILF